MRSPTTRTASTVTQDTGEHSTDGMVWAARPGTQSRNTPPSSRMKSGVVPQQPPAANRPSSR